MTVLPLRRPSESRRVLVLEDHDLLRSSMVRALSELPGVAAVGVGTLRDALVEMDATRPALIISDLDLPDGSGLELMPHISGKEQPPIVFVSGHVGRFESQLNHYPGVVVLDKPLPTRTLKYIVGEQLESDRGAAAPFAAGDYIQLACLGRHSVRIDVHGPEIDGSIHIKQGRLWAAQAGRRSGLSALRRLIFTEGTSVSCSGGGVEPSSANLPDLPWEQMLLDLAKQHDEGTRELPIVEPDVTEEIDFSDIFEDPTPSAPAPAPDVDIPAVRTSDETRFERILDDAHEALLNKDYPAALLAFETAEALRPSDSVVKGNVARLRQLIEQ